MVIAEQAWLQARLTSITAQANRLGDSAALLQALGGGWWNDPDNARSVSGCESCAKATPAS
ncbi:MAG: hypothetical protein CBCREVIR_3144 [Candidatus Burkholderia crenata]|nr:MAG: hypothetical protein CBCREVIR_3144 [Candidatus Burkholderia crenata]